MLDWFPEKRASASDLLKHSWLKDVPSFDQSSNSTVSESTTPASSNSSSQS